jgi:prepilin-type processing-associated H-X9-DG protein
MLDCTMRRHRPRGLTLIELLVIFLILAVVAAIVIPLVTRQHDRSSRAMCASRLRAIGQSILMYSNDNRGMWPRTRAAREQASLPPTWGTGAAATDPFADQNGPADNDVSAAIFLLLRTQDITPEVLTCPATNAEADKYAGLTPVQRSNFTDVKRNLSYSYANPYIDERWRTNSMARNLLRNSPPAHEAAIAADINPGEPGNSVNHRRRGQNVLYGDGHVAWQASPHVGVDGDDIYTTADGKIIAPPYDASDSILLPTDD